MNLNLKTSKEQALREYKEAKAKLKEIVCY